jgi:O-acetylserine/cysteine efflux transporter
MRPFHCFLAILIAAVWGINFIFIQLGLQDIPPLMLCALRFLFTSIPAIFFIKRPSIPFKTLLVYGLCMFGLQFSFLFLGMHAGMAPGLTSLVAQIQVFFSLFFAMLLLGETLASWQVLGAMIAFSGIIFVGLHTGGEVSLVGLCLVLAGAAAWGMGNVITKMIGSVSVVSLVAWGSLIAFPPLCLLSLYFEGAPRIYASIQHLNHLDVISVLFIAYVSTWFGYGTWSWLLRQYPVFTVTPFSLLVPIFGMLSSILLMNEPIESWKFVSAILIVTGLCIHLFGARVVNSFSKLNKGVVA